MAHPSAPQMVLEYLGETDGIHGGGQDLVFPHHENEIAQSESANGKLAFVRFWMHNGFVNIDQEKMSNPPAILTVRDLAQHYDYLVLRFFMLGAHYQMPINFSAELTAAQNGWNRIQTSLSDLEFWAGKAPAATDDPQALQAARELEIARSNYKQAFIEAMDDDLNTADALAAIFELVRAANTAITVPGLDSASIRRTKSLLEELLDVLGLQKGQTEEEIPDEILQLSPNEQRPKTIRILFGRTRFGRKYKRVALWSWIQHRVRRSAKGDRIDVHRGST